MAEFDIDLGKLGAKFGEMLNRADDAAASALGLGLEVMTKEARALAPAGSTGHLRLGIRAGAVSGSLSSGTLSGSIIADTAYAEAQNSGSGLYGPKRAKYPIRPKNKKALRWAVQGFIGPVAPSIQGVKGTLAASSSSGFAFSRGVMHPGVKGTLFLDRAVEAKIGVLEREMAEAIETAIVGE